MKNSKLFFTIALIVLILFAESCATKKKAYKDGPSGAAGNTSQAVKPPASVSGSEEFVYEFDVMVDVDPQKVAQPRPDYPEEVPASEKSSTDTYGQQPTSSQSGSAGTTGSSSTADSRAADNLAANSAVVAPGSVGSSSSANDSNKYAEDYSAGFAAGYAAGTNGDNVAANIDSAGSQNSAYVEGYTAGFAAGEAMLSSSNFAGDSAGTVAADNVAANTGSAGTPGNSASGSSLAGSSALSGTSSAERAFGSPGGPGGKERRNNNLVGPGSVNVEGVMDYIKIRNRNPSFNEESARRIINAYVDEAVKEDVNYDFAIAQMLYWTAFLTNKQRVDSNNIAGLQTTNTWRGTFPTTEDGVKAHIQHLRGYSHGTLKNPNVKPIDPRWDHISHFRGTIKNFEQIYPRWSQSTARYRRNIILILNDMYRYSDRYSNLYR